ncbi:unnamed protein product [Allacma fusca]|uniref:Kappa-casein n=1 Tax=Allacma fusca TaxID=39272 RepID=A0A8J2L7X7_9HEXA|nr:unnamed protein product [Allacma fusca]
MTLKLLFVFIFAPHIWSLPVPGTFDYHDVNYVNLENTFMSKPSYDYAVPYQMHPSNFQNAHLPSYLRQEIPAYHILKPEYPSHLYPLHTVFFITAGNSQNQGIRPQTLQQRFDYPDVEYDQTQGDVPSEAPKFHVQPESAPGFPAQADEPKFHVQPATPSFHIQPPTTEFHVQPEAFEYHPQPETLQFHITPESAGFNDQPETPSFHLQVPHYQDTVKDDSPALPIIVEESDRAPTGNVEPEGGNKSPEVSPEFAIVKMEPGNSNENVNINDRFGSDSSEISKMPQGIPPPVLISVDVENVKVNPQSTEFTQSPEIPSSSGEANMKPTSNVDVPVEIPSIPFHFQPFQNSAVQTHEPIQEEDDGVVSEVEPLNREESKSENLPGAPVESEKGSSEQESSVNVSVVPDNLPKEGTDSTAVDDEIPMTTENNGVEVDDTVQAQNTKVVEFEATTETAQTSFK